MHENTCNKIVRELGNKGVFGNELNYVERTSRFFLCKCQDDLDSERRGRAEEDEERHVAIFDWAIGWGKSVALKTNGRFDNNSARILIDLRQSLLKNAFAEGLA